MESNGTKVQEWPTLDEKCVEPFAKFVPKGNQTWVKRAQKLMDLCFYPNKSKNGLKNNQKEIQMKGPKKDQKENQKKPKRIAKELKLISKEPK